MEVEGKKCKWGQAGRQRKASAERGSRGGSLLSVPIMHHVLQKALCVVSQDISSSRAEAHRMVW